MHDETATTQPPRITDLDDAHVERDRQGFLRPGVPGEDSSPNAWVCPFLRAIDDDDRLGRPVEVPDIANRCASHGDPMPQSLRQQELVCLTSGHVNCPRYLRGSLLSVEEVEPVARPTVVTPAIAGSVVVLVVAFLVSIAFVVANGGVALTAAVAVPSAVPSASPSGYVLAEVETAAPTATPAPASTPDATPTRAPTPTATPAATATSVPTATPTATPSATPEPTPQATPKPTPAATPKPATNYPAGATASRMKLLTPCPDKAKCYIYRIRSGDNLYSIANYFGVSFTTIKAWNAWTDSGLKVGRELRIPPPTR